jgi:hypothetical protein
MFEAFSRFGLDACNGSVFYLLIVVSNDPVAYSGSFILGFFVGSY